MNKSITFSYIKFGATKNSAEIIKIIQDKGFTIEAMKPFLFGRNTAETFYKEHVEKSFYPSLVEFTTKGPVLVMIISSEKDTITSFRKIIGATDPNKAAVGTIRQLFGNATAYMNGAPANAIHGSDSHESAIREIKLICPEFDLTPYL